MNKHFNGYAHVLLLHQTHGAGLENGVARILFELPNQQGSESGEAIGGYLGSHRNELGIDLLDFLLHPIDTGSNTCRCFIQ